MRKKLALLIVLSLPATLWGSLPAKSPIEIKDNWYYLNGQRFFIKAIGYEIGARPGQNPYTGVRAEDLNLMAFDLKVIKDAGYNTIRTWSQFTEPQLKLVQDSGLKLIMGIDVKPDRDYGEPQFVKDCEDSLRQVLSYSRKYDCIITYLILNEPQTDHLHKVSGKAFIHLMQTLMNMIHQEHPGIPVTISANAMISDYLDENLFDVYAYNGYDHTEAQTATMGFKDYIGGLYELDGRKKPLIITEFGYSVSHRGYGRYGGNTLTQQRDGLLANYRDLLDAGAVGLCPFYYADGWWKGGDPANHNPDQPEEWFGFWGYRDAQDKYGTPRPVWFALRDYMKALIISPKNKSIYTNTTIPLELYTDPDVKKVVVKVNDRAIYSQAIKQAGYFAGQLSLSPKGIEDLELAFEFYNNSDRLIKAESIQILAATNGFALPKFLMAVTPAKDLNAATQAHVKIDIQNQPGFKILDDLRVSFNTHLGWEVGPQATIPIKDQLDKPTLETETTFPIPDNCWIVNASAGVPVQYGKFTFRIHDQKIIYRGDWASEIGRKD